MNKVCSEFYVAIENQYIHMKTNKLKYIFFFAIAVVAVYITVNSFSQPGVSDLQTEFREVAFYRNENNTGPVIRVYAVTVSDTLWNELEQYGGFMPHNKYGNTKVFFFSKNQLYPKAVNPGGTNFDQEFERYVLAKYEKDGLGRESFIVHE